MISPLPFDTSLFGYPVGKIILNEAWDEQAFLEQAKDFHLVYIMSQKPVVFTDSRIKLTDTKVTFSKKVLGNTAESSSDTKLYSGDFHEKLLELALESGAYSRFKTDPRLTQNEFQKLYEIWIKKAWESKRIIVAPKLQGMVSYGLVDKVASIGLIAVEKASQGKGWGKRLMQAAEAKAFLYGAEMIEVSTQENNAPACRLYQSLGYELAEKLFVYHWYNE